MNLTVDASVFVAASRADEVHYRASRQFLQQIQAQQCDLYCPTLVLPECAAAIARPTADARLAEELVLLIQGLPRLHLVPLDVTLAQHASQVARDHRIRGADSVYVSVAGIFDSKLVAWDAELLERGAGVVTTMTPLEWMEEPVA
ncbi:MAG: PIN domain-containing protein [Anaerolineae bacterium]|nr:PIN domain-containing protein [Anaerolineae bacterium]